MKDINKDLIKSIGISILVVFAVILLVMVLSYDKISIGKVIPKAEQYELSNEMQEELASEELEENSEVITTYELDATDLKQYEKTNEYNKGKKDPFAESTESSENNNNDNSTSDDSNSTSNSNTSNSSTSENFYDDDGTK